jgi:glycosyltransferase involved in cell wall biosynthesis
MTAVRAAAFAGGQFVPSARFRVRQYIPALERYGVQLVEQPCYFGKYPPSSLLMRPFWAAAALSEQAWRVAKVRHYDVVLLQRELISKLISFESYIRAPVVLDVDDAIYLFGDGGVARRLAQGASVIVCGNAELATHFSRWNSSIQIIPTAVDTDRYSPRVIVEPEIRSSTLVIGWIGTSGNLCELEAIEPALVAVLARIPQARLRVVCDQPPKLTSLNQGQLEYVPWNAVSEHAEIQAMDIGIMPLRDSAWARGKCSFKMLQYMACGLPVVVSPVGMNAEVARFGDCALTPTSCSDWADALTELSCDTARQRKMGQIGRQIVLERFSVSVLAPQLAGVIKSARQ